MLINSREGVVVKYLLALVFFTMLSANASAQTYQQTCQYVGNMRVCNGTTFPDLVGSTAAAAQADKADAQADLARQQTAMLKQQQQASQQGPSSPGWSGAQHTSELYRRCLRQSPPANTEKEALAVTSRCEKEVGSNFQAPRPSTAGASTDQLKASAATLEAIMRSAPPDSEAFRNAAQSLQATNEELAKRGALK